MEEVILQVEINPDGCGARGEILSARFGQTQLNIRGTTLRNLLRSIHERGWQIVRATAIPKPRGTQLAYHFKRSLA